MGLSKFVFTLSEEQSKKNNIALQSIVSTPLDTFHYFWPMDHEYDKAWSSCSSIYYIAGRCVHFSQLGRLENLLLLISQSICLRGMVLLVLKFSIITTTTSILYKTRFLMLHCAWIVWYNKLVSKIRWKTTFCLFSQPIMIWHLTALLVWELTWNAYK